MSWDEGRIAEEKSLGTLVRSLTLYAFSRKLARWRCYTAGVFLLHVKVLGRLFGFLCGYSGFLDILVRIRVFCWRQRHVQAVNILFPDAIVPP